MFTSTEYTRDRLSELCLVTAPVSLPDNTPYAVGSWIEPPREPALFESTVSPLSSDLLNLNFDICSNNNLNIPRIKDPRQELINEGSPEQKHLLNYRTDEQLQEIRAFFDDSRIPRIQALITEGSWQQLMTECGRMLNLDKVFLAAFCQQRLSISELTSAMVLYRAYHNSAEGQVQIEAVNPSHFPMFEHAALDRDLPADKRRENTLKRIEATLKNQQYVLTISMKAFDCYTANVIQNTLYDVLCVNVDAALNKTLCISSFGLAKTFYTELDKQTGGFENGHQLSPVLGLTPTFDEMVEHILQGFSDVALLGPTECPRIHGSCDPIIWPFAHDLLHTMARLTRKGGQAGVDMAKKYRPPSNIDISAKLDPNSERVEPVFKEKPTLSEMKLYVVSQVRGALVDGLYESLTEAGVRDLFYNARRDLNKAWSPYSQKDLAEIDAFIELQVKVYGYAWKLPIISSAL